MQREEQVPTQPGKPQLPEHRLYFEYDGEYIYPDVEEYPSIVKDCVLLMVDNMCGPFDEMEMLLVGASHPQMSAEQGTDKCDCRYNITVVWPPHYHFDRDDDESSTDEEEQRLERRPRR